MLEVGHVVRAHGLRGEVVVELGTSLESRLSPGSTLTLAPVKGNSYASRGDVPAEGAGQEVVVVSARPFPGRPGPHGERWLVCFQGVTDREGAEALGGTALLAPPVEGAEGLWVHELIGALVVETDGTERGRVTSVEANPASDLLVLSSGGLVPLRFVVSFEPGRLTVEVPAGLFDL